MCPKITQRSIGKLENKGLLFFSKNVKAITINFVLPQFHAPFREFPLLTTKPIQSNTPRIFALDTPLINIRAERGCQAGQFSLCTMVSVQSNISSTVKVVLQMPTPHWPSSASQPRTGGADGQRTLTFQLPTPEEGTRRKA